MAKERVERDEEDLVRLYLTDIGQYPLLTKDDEVRLAQAIEAGNEARAVEILHAESNPFLATIGLRVDPAPVGSGLEFRLQVDHRTVPLYLYKTAESFAESMAGYIRRTLQEGLFGWQVTDCTVTMTHSGYVSPSSTAGSSSPR